VVRIDDTKQAGDALPEEAGGTAQEGPAVESDLLKQSRLDLHVIIGRNTWVKKDNSALELTGDLRVKKDRGEENIGLVGSIRVEHGWIYLYGRRFNPQQGVVTFTGGNEIDPSLDVVLESRVAEYRVETIVKGTASKPELSFESDPHLEDADVLALLMFGRPIHELGDGEKTSLEQQAADFAAGYAASKVSQRLGDALGIQISEVDVSSGRLGIGRYLSPKTYVSIIQSLSGSREVNLDYYFTPSWTARASTDSEGENAVDLFWHKKY
jgi:translocation and assembly module TamB